MDKKIRCFGHKEGQELYAKYHDEEWGIPNFDDTHLFEMLTLEGAQAGLSWFTILKKREGYRKSFKNFNPNKVAVMTDDELTLLLDNKEIIRNKLKIFSVRKNAIAFINIQKEFGSFSTYLWNFVNNKPIKHNYINFNDVPVSDDLSNLISKDLKKRGMSFVGSTIIYSYMQAVGLYDDHISTCFIRKEL